MQPKDFKLVLLMISKDSGRNSRNIVKCISIWKGLWTKSLNYDEVSLVAMSGPMKGPKSVGAELAWWIITKPRGQSKNRKGNCMII